MYAVFQSGGKQHRVAEGQTVRLEKIEVAPGETVEFDNVLMVSNGLAFSHTVLFTATLENRVHILLRSASL